MKINFVDSVTGAENIVILLGKNKKLGKIGEDLDKKNKFSPLLNKLEDHSVSVYVDSLLVTLVKLEDKLNKLKAQEAGGELYKKLTAQKIKEVSIIYEEKDSAEILANVALGMKLQSYEFSKYKTKKKEDKVKLEKVNIVSSEAKLHWKELEKLAEAIFVARDYVSEPPNMLYPASYAESCRDKLSPLGVKIEILDEKQMKKLGMGALLGVGQGSSKESRLVIMHYEGGKKDTAPVAFIGKGVTFDAGGISLKPADGMWDMKYDMGGSAAVVGVMHLLAARKAKVNAVGIIGLVENMPDGDAQRPSDVVTSLSGQTIEVLNTDAEGRLVLADALWYCQEKYKPQFMINLATLTGAIIVALGSNIYAGLFSNSDDLANKLSKAGEISGERVWRLPLGEEYDKMIDSDIADVKNISTERGAGSVIAGQFLQRFVNGTKWAHLDIAGMAWDKKGKATCPKGAVGFGVKLLDQLVREYYEQ